MGTNCTPLIADLVLFCYERFYDVSFSDTEVNIIEALTQRLYIWTARPFEYDYPYFEDSVRGD